MLVRMRINSRNRIEQMVVYNLGKPLPGSVIDKPKMLWQKDFI